MTTGICKTINLRLLPGNSDKSPAESPGQEKSQAALPAPCNQLSRHSLFVTVQTCIDLSGKTRHCHLTTFSISKGKPACQLSRLTLENCPTAKSKLNSCRLSPKRRVRRLEFPRRSSLSSSTNWKGITSESAVDCSLTLTSRIHTLGRSAP